jgi:hypothetical protein
VQATRVVDHSRGQIDARDIDAALLEEGRDGSRAAADVKDRPDLPNGISEGVHRCSQPRLHADVAHPGRRDQLHADGSSCGA